MKKRTCIALATMFCVSSVSANEGIDSDVAEVEPYFITYAWVAGKVMEGAGNAIKSGAKSALQDAIFGPDSPSYVHLSEQSLQQIEGIVQSAFDNDAKEGMINHLEALELSMKSYSDVLNHSGERDVNLLAIMETQSNFLYTSPAFNSTKSYYDDITVHYSAAAAFRYSILADKVHFGNNSIPFLESQGSQMATSVSAMGAASDNKIAENVYLTSYQTTQCKLNRAAMNDTEELILTNGTPAICYDYYVTDNLDGSSYRYRYQDHGGINSSMARNKVSSLSANYLNTLKGEDYQNVIDDLQQNYN